MKKKQPLNHAINSLGIVFFFLSIVCILAPGNGIAQGSATFDALGMQNLSKAPSAPSQIASPNPSSEALANQIAVRLREKRSAIHAKKFNSYAQTKSPSSPHASKADPLREQLYKELDIRIHPNSGTPRQIKLRPEAQQKGLVLGRAIQGMAPGRERDEQTARTFMNAKRNFLHIQNPDDELRLSRYSKDEIGRCHLRYTQFFQGLPVWPAALNIHLDADGNVDLINGAYVATPQRMVTKPVWDKKAAVKQARNAVPRGENAIVGDPELIVYAPGDTIPRLAWKMEIKVSVEMDWLVVIDALNGNTLTAYNQAMNENISGTGVDLFGKKQQINVWHEGNRYYMIDTTKQMYDNTSDPPAFDKTRGAIMIYDMGNKDIPEDGNLNLQQVFSQTPTAGWLSDAVSLAWCFSKTYDYYLSRHNRNSFDGKGISIVGVVRWSKNLDNAMFSGDANMMFFGDGAPNAGSIDIVAHEFTHGVTHYESDLIYRNQSGALNEAYSDIFGEMVEAYAYGKADWINGAVLNDNGRNSKDPSHQEIQPGTGDYYPAKMSEYYVTASDNGGVHINCTIISHCFYLLAEGMQGAIGLKDAERIFYRAQKFHLVSNSQFVDCRLACIASAEEIFGQDSSQAQKVAEAFDAVEIFDNTHTPEPPPITPVNNEDSVMFISYSPLYGGFFLTRQEKALGDSAKGAWISCSDVSQARPSVSGDGSLAFFVNSVNDACFILTDTDGSACEECLNMPGVFKSAAMSSDGQVYAFVVLDESGDPTDSITTVDLRPGGRTQTYALVSPTIDGVAMNTIDHADTMDFSLDNRYLYYDALNIIQFNDGTLVGVWSIYAIDRIHEQTISLFGPLAGVDIGYPAISHTTPHLITFDVLDEATGNSTILAVDLIHMTYGEVGTVPGAWGVPGYTGDDRAVVYTRKDVATATGFSLMKQPLAQDRITPTGSPALFMKDAAYGVIYRRGEFSPPLPRISVSPGSLSFGSVPVNSKVRKQLTISNTGTGDLIITGIYVSGADAAQYQIAGGCAGQTLPATGSCTFYVDFMPASAGTKNAVISIKSSDPAAPNRNIKLSGSGGAPVLQAPSKLFAKAISSTQIVLSWKDNSNNETGFKIERNTGGCGPKNQWKQIALRPKNTTSHTIPALSPNTAYAFRVRAYNTSGTSLYSNCATAKTGLSGTPPAPSHLMAVSASTDKINLNWKDNASNENGFKIYRKIGAEPFQLLATIGSDVTGFIDDSAKNNLAAASYQYCVCSYNSAGDSPRSNTAIIPFRPVNLSAMPGSSLNTITLTWIDKSSNETGFEIYRKSGDCQSGDAWELIKTLGANVRTWTHTGLTSGVAYSYQVRAFNKSAAPAAYGFSGFSNCKSATAR